MESSRTSSSNDTASENRPVGAQRAEHLVPQLDRHVAGQRTGDDSGWDRRVAAEAGAALRTPGGMKWGAWGRSWAVGNVLPFAEEKYLGRM